MLKLISLSKSRKSLIPTLVGSLSQVIKDLGWNDEKKGDFQVVLDSGKDIRSTFLSLENWLGTQLKDDQKVAFVVKCTFLKNYVCASIFYSFLPRKLKQNVDSLIAGFFEEEDIDLGHPIAEGSFKCVFEHPSNDQFVIKRAKDRKSNLLVLADAFFDSFFNENSFPVVSMDSEGRVFLEQAKFLSSRSPQIVDFFNMCLISAVNQLVDFDIVHGDLSKNNLMYNSLNHNVKIIDWDPLFMFGLDRFSFGGTYPSMRALLVRLEADNLFGPYNSKIWNALSPRDVTHLDVFAIGVEWALTTFEGVYLYVEDSNGSFSDLLRQVGQLYDFLATLFLEITSKDGPEKNIAIFYGFFMDDIDLANIFLHSLRGLMVRNNVSESYIPSETWSEPFNSMLAFPCLQPQWSMSDVHDALI